MKKIAIIGTQGVPAQYGGFESLAENLIGTLRSPEIQYTVYCSGRAYKDRLYEYKDARLEYINLKANGVHSIFYDILSLIKASRCHDIILVLGVSGCCILPLYRLFFPMRKLVINIDGLEHRREKWGKIAKKFLKFSEKMAIKYANTIVTDNKGIQDYVLDEYGKDSVLITYGGDHALVNDMTIPEQMNVLKDYNLKAKDYAITVCRIEPENNCHITLEAFSKTEKQIVFIGNWNRCEYGKVLKEKYSIYENIKMLDPIYDIDTLFALRKNAAMYIHGHSAGGTNPSLVEAMFFNIPIVAYKVVYNVETTHNKALYFSGVNELIHILNSPKTDLIKHAEVLKGIAEEQYTWNKIVKQYESVY